MMETRAVLIDTQVLAKNIFRMQFSVPTIAAGILGGQFVHLEVPGFSLRRPFTVAEVDGDSITLVIRRQGRGTAALVQARVGQEFRMLGPLGRGFSPGANPILIGGGIGAAALTLLAQTLPQCTIVMGGRNWEELWLEKLTLPATVSVQYATDDGSRGFRGNLVQYAQEHLHAGMWVAACGPEPMLAGLQKLMAERGISGEFALEQRMACGLGACMGCTCRSKEGNALVCKDGPVFPAQEVVFDEHN